MTNEMRNCLKQLCRIFNGLKQIEPGDDEYARVRKTMESVNIAKEDLQAWSVSDFKNRRPPTEAQMRAMLCLCRKWDYMSNIFDMRFSESELDSFETAINDYVFLGTQRNE